MALIHAPNTKPAAGAMVNWGHPLAQGLGFLAPANEGGGRILKNELKPFGSPQSTDYGHQEGIAEWVNIEPWGMSYWIGLGGSATAGTGWQETTSSLTAIAIPNYTASACVMFFDLSGSGGTFRNFFSKNSAANARFSFQREAADVRLGVNIASVSTYVTLTGFAEAFVPYVLTLVVEQDTTTTYLSVYSNGVLQGTNSVASLVPAEANTIKLATSTGNSRTAFGGGFYWMYAMPPEMVALHACDPFAMYRDSHISRLAGSLAAGPTIPIFDKHYRMLRAA